MAPVTFEQSIAVEQIGTDEYKSVHLPFWTWPNSIVVPGGTLMSLAAAAAYETVKEGFCIDTLHTYFLAGPKYDRPLTFEVKRISGSGKFATHAVTVKQDGVPMVHITCSFVRTAAMTGPSMTHAISRATSVTIDSITLDDLGPFRDSRGPVTSYQRLLVTPYGDYKGKKNAPPEALTYTAVGVIDPPISSADAKTQALGIIALSDYHILDGPPTLHGIPFGQAAIGDYSRTPTPQTFSLFTSLSHTIRFHNHEGFRADKLCYIEVTSPWTARRRAEVQSRMFDQDGKLIATCVQGSYYVAKDGSKL